MHRKLTGIITAFALMVSCMLPAAAFGDEETLPEAEPQEVSEAAAAESEAPAEDPAEASTEAPTEVPMEAETVSFEVSIAVPGEENPVYLIKDKSFSLNEGEGLEELAELLAEEDYRITFDKDGRIEKLQTPEGESYGEGGIWQIAWGEEEPSDSTEAYDRVPQNGDRLELIYTAVEETAAEEEAVSEPMAAMAVSDDDIAFSYGNTRDKLLKEGDSSGWPYGSEFSIVGNARAGYMTEERAAAYTKNLIAELESRGSAQLDDKQSSDNAKAVLALTSLGMNPSDVGGYNLLEPLADMNFVMKQGMNGPVWALIAFDCGRYEIPAVKAGGVQVTREKLISTILNLQKADGGWAYSGNSDIDMTGMVLQSLAPYYSTDSKVKAAVDKALTWLSAHQNSKGEFATTASVTSESQSQVIVALTSLGIDPAKDPRFVKNGNSAIDALLSYYVAGGGFKHVEANWKANGLATVQGNYALVAYYRFISGQSSLYDMTDSGSYNIDVDYVRDNRTPSDRSDKPGTATTATATGASTSVSTRSLGLIRASGSSSEEALNVIDKIRAVTESGLPDSASDYTNEQVKSIEEAYAAYLELDATERLAVEKDEVWEKFSEITGKLGEAYHYHELSGIDLRDNEEEVLPWYVKLEPAGKKFADEQKEEIFDLLGENGIIYYSYDVKLVNTLDDSEWEPEKVVKVSFRMPEETGGLNPVVIHEGEGGRLEFIEVEAGDDGKTVSFRTGSFSLFALAGTSEDVGKMIGKSTGSVLPWCIGGAAALALAALLIVFRRKLR